MALGWVGERGWVMEEMNMGYWGLSCVCRRTGALAHWRFRCKGWARHIWALWLPTAALRSSFEHMNLAFFPSVSSFPLWWQMCLPHGLESWGPFAGSVQRLQLLTTQNFYSQTSNSTSKAKYLGETTTIARLCECKIPGIRQPMELNPDLHVYSGFPEIFSMLHDTTSL
jgi:hypothetical protein